jgi:hypothetical protein
MPTNQGLRWSPAAAPCCTAATAIPSRGHADAHSIRTMGYEPADSLAGRATLWHAPLLAGGGVPRPQDQPFRPLTAMSEGGSLVGTSVRSGGSPCPPERKPQPRPRSSSRVRNRVRLRKRWRGATSPKRRSPHQSDARSSDIAQPHRPVADVGACRLVARRIQREETRRYRRPTRRAKLRPTRRRSEAHTPLTL